MYVYNDILYNRLHFPSSNPDALFIFDVRPFTDFIFCFFVFLFLFCLLNLSPFSLFPWYFKFPDEVVALKLKIVNPKLVGASTETSAST